MKSLNNIYADIMNLADYVGGNHFTNKEIESKLHAIAKDISDASYQIRKITDPKPIVEITGISDTHYRILQREENIKENEKK